MQKFHPEVDNKKMMELKKGVNQLQNLGHFKKGFGICFPLSTFMNQNLGFLSPLSTTLRLVNWAWWFEKHIFSEEGGKHGFDMDSRMEHVGKIFWDDYMWVYQKNKDQIGQLTFIIHGSLFFVSSVKTPGNIQQ